MVFHLAFTPKKMPDKLNYRQPILLLGSCFTENMGEKLMQHKFNVLQNPNGILFNPISVKEAVENYIGNKQIGENDIFFLQEGWHSWQHHSRFSSPDPQKAIEQINCSTQQAHHFLKSGAAVIITLGSAWVYELTEKAIGALPGKVAANNHKAPADWFHRRLLNVGELQEILLQVIKKLQAFNPSLKIIFTISPVRHLREGFVENNRSKALLIHAVHEVVEQFNHLYYFPAYELVIDDLRDYRFYAEDMVHPNYAATQYVWQKFIDCCIDESSQLFIQKINEINAAKNHRAFNPESEAHKKFLVLTHQKLLSLKAQFPEINLEEEFNYFKT
ncbi:MAG: GSCFA domain-containing protein [Niastella sp.]|nr:GSCFA domain-containing protein [Niastella sp.]